MLNRLWPYLLLTPFLIVFVLFFVMPVVLGVWESLFRQTLVGGRMFVGFDNFAAVSRDAAFWGSLLRVLAFMAIFTPLAVGLGLLLALALDSGAVAGGWAYRLFFFLPYVIPGVVASVMWGFLYGGTFGPLNDILEAIGAVRFDFLSQDVALYSIGNISLWMYVGFNMIILYSALQSVSPELSEAAVIDGASRWQIARRIKTPLLAPVLSVMAIFSIIGTLQLFTEPRVMMPTAPDVIGRDYVPNLYLYSLATTGQQFNYVAAAAIVLAGVTFLIATVYTAVSRIRSGS